MHDTSPATAQERVAIVSGAAGGLGAAIVQRLATDGFAVATCDLSPAAGSALHAELDVVDRDAVGAFVARVEVELGPPSVVVTAAGVQRTGASETVEEEDWRRVVDVNLTGTWNVVQAALPGMLERGDGRIVTLSSEIGLAGLERYAAYAASKGGVIALTKALARELAPRGICVNSVAPGPIEAGMLLREAAYSDDWLAAHVPLGRWGRASEVAASVAFLAGDGGGYYVGQVLSPNGGTVI
jgi:NAD(P)-dependent dehydrogenase (short-subunit alcohol dehydrogenase family)